MSKTVEEIFALLSEHDIRSLLSEYDQNSPMPTEFAPPAVIALGLVEQVMLKSGRNPQYGFKLSAQGIAFCQWIRSVSLNEYIAKHK